MKIEEIIKIWEKSKYETLIIKSLPNVNHKGEIIRGTGIYSKNQTIMCGGKYKIEDYLKKIYKDSIFIYRTNNNGLEFIMIAKRGEI